MKRYSTTTAYHEAGHAVAAWRLGVSIGRRGVTVIPNETDAGSTSHHEVVRRSVEWDSSDKNRIRAERLAQICLAGEIAQHRFSPHSIRHYHSRSDLHTAIDVLSFFSGSTQEVSAWIKLLRVRTEMMFSNPDVWRAVEMLAEALVRKGKLTGREATEIIRAGFDERLKLRAIARSVCR